MSSFPSGQERSDLIDAAAAEQFGGVAQEQLQESIYPSTKPVSYPDIDVIDAGEEILVYADLPGCSAEDIHVRINQQTLVISAERESELEGDDTLVLSERAPEIERVLTLPAVVRAGGAEASLSDGVCAISLPKTSTDRFEEITVKSD
ncbi:Hsp20/alpha crystallin family protein [Halobaculum limi]|uniref:Hsp20/alpha crystallin family protein n=1 Tax=Halobaculum limi TaxID=3031916 RepID=UPI0024069BAC|nr:Hsp20/alpha crystallin family protein [Halobaculum sp. YSMS11]